MKLLNFKKEFYDFCLQEVQNQITHIQTAIKNQREGSEGKSSAGDKHNTEQAMQHLELEKKQQQLALAQNNLQLLRKINIHNAHKKVGLGTLLKANLGTVFIAAPIGKLRFKGEEVYVVSTVSPVAIALVGKTLQAEVVLNGSKWQIKALI